MNPFGTPKVEIRRAITILEQARVLPTPQERQEHARLAIPALGNSRFAGKLAQVVERRIEDDDLDRAIELLQNLLDGDAGQGGKSSGKPPQRVLLRVAAGLLVPLLGLGAFFAVSATGGDKAEALVSLEQCRESQRALGTPIGVRKLALPGVDNNSNAELAKRSLPVQGSEGAGRYTYLAEKARGEWTIRHGVLETDDRYLMIVPCGGSVTESDAEGRLSQGYSGAGHVSSVEGSAPVQGGDACTVEVHPDPNFPGTVTFNCRVAVTCGGVALYGVTPDVGYVFCSARDGAPAMAVDGTGSAGERGGDPMIRMDLPGGQVKISEDTGWSVTVELDR